MEEKQVKMDLLVVSEETPTPHELVQTNDSTILLNTFSSVNAGL